MKLMKIGLMIPLGALFLKEIPGHIIRMRVKENFFNALYAGVIAVNIPKLQRN